MNYFKITGLENGEPIEPYGVETDASYPVINTGLNHDSVRYYEPITKEEYIKLTQKNNGEEVAHDYLTIGQLTRLINRLKQEGKVTDETIVILSKDAEGNHFGAPGKNGQYCCSLDFAFAEEDTIYSDTFTLYPIYEYLEPVYGYGEED
jgi:hypothetical protein